MKSQTLRDYYQKRQFFIVSFLVTLALGFYWDLKPRFDEFYALLQQEKNISSLLVEKEKALQGAEPYAERLRKAAQSSEIKPLLDQVVQAAEGSACWVAHLQTELKNTERTSATVQGAPALSNRLLIKMQMKGDFLSFSYFLETLVKESLPLQWDHFSMKGQDEVWEFNLQFSAFPWALGLARKNQTKQAALEPEPFFYAGSMEQAGKRVVLVRFPDGRIQDFLLKAKR